MESHTLTVENSVEKSIEIAAPASSVWKVFTDPAITRQLGGEYVTDWTLGSSIGWKGLDGQMQTRGTILNIVPERLLRHDLAYLNAVPDGGTPPTVAIITYELREENGRTTLHAREDFTKPVTDKEIADAAQGWDAVLMAFKGLAER